MQVRLPPSNDPLFNHKLLMYAKDCGGEQLSEYVMQAAYDFANSTAVGCHTNHKACVTLLKKAGVKVSEVRRACKDESLAVKIAAKLFAKLTDIELGLFYNAICIARNLPKATVKRIEQAYDESDIAFGRDDVDTDHVEDCFTVYFQTSQR